MNQAEVNQTICEAQNFLKNDIDVSDKEKANQLMDILDRLYKCAETETKYFVHSKQDKEFIYRNIKRFGQIFSNFIKRVNISLLEHCRHALRLYLYG